MRPKYFGECYDNAKREIMRNLVAAEPWAVHPMYFVQHQTVEDRQFIGSYQRYLRAAVVNGDIWTRDEFPVTASACREHLLLDPDTELGWNRSKEHVSIDEFVEIVTSECRRDRLTLVYDRSNLRWGEELDVREQTRIKLICLRRRNIHAVAYLSHVGLRVSFIWASCNPNIVSDAAEKLLVDTEFPEGRFVDDGCGHTEDVQDITSLPECGRRVFYSKNGRPRDFPKDRCDRKLCS